MPPNGREAGWIMHDKLHIWWVSLALLASCKHLIKPVAHEEQGLRGVLCNYGHKDTLPLSRSLVCDVSQGFGAPGPSALRALTAGEGDCIFLRLGAVWAENGVLRASQVIVVSILRSGDNATDGAPFFLP